MSPTTQRDWLNDYEPQLPSDIPPHLHAVVKQVVVRMRTTPGVTINDVADVFAPYVDRERARTLAFTEATRADVAATNAQQRYLAQRGVRQIRFWYTNNDPHVCDTCAAFAGQPEHVWCRAFPLGPPAHEGCRCTIGLRLDRQQPNVQLSRAPDTLLGQLRRFIDQLRRER
jgi:hypothetical protein